ncbi:hypothetical protein KFU94_45220 [Chloroflexi bacterium TSY]|nr:hypothetical protein [Chloroflexi bacterium TSY]
MAPLCWSNLAKIAAASPFQHGPDFSWHGSVTNQSGKVHLVHFRRSCDKEFRYFSQQLARSSRQQSRWASAYFTQARQKGHSVSRSHRALANRWLAILWKMWQDRTTYDESFHIRQRTIRRRPQA